MTGRRTWASDEERDGFLVDVAEEHAARLALLEPRPVVPAFGLTADVTSVDAGDAAQEGASGRVADAAHQHAVTLAPTALASYYNHNLSDITISTVAQDVTPALAVTLADDGMILLWGHLDVRVTTSGSVDVVGELAQDGVVDAGLRLLQATARVPGRWTVGQTWRLPLSAGTYQFRLRARKDGASGVVHINEQTTLLALALPGGT